MSLLHLHPLKTPEKKRESTVSCRRPDDSHVVYQQHGISLTLETKFQCPIWQSSSHQGKGRILKVGTEDFYLEMNARLKPAFPAAKSMRSTHSFTQCPLPPGTEILHWLCLMETNMAPGEHVAFWRASNQTFRTQAAKCSCSTVRAGH